MSTTSAGAEVTGPSIRWTKEAVELVGLDDTTVASVPADDWAKVFTVHVGDSREDRPAILGSYRIVGNVVRFEPRFPVRKGVTHRATFHPARLPKPGGLKPIVADFIIPKPVPANPTVVRQVYPTTDKLPENQLKFYIHFSDPMSRGEAYRHIRLIDEKTGKAVEDPFLELGEELWDPSGKRFTVFFDPGRIKRGLKPREEVGPALEEGKRYTLVIDAKWSDAEGNPLKETFRKAFQVGAPDDAQPDVKAWKLLVPAAGTIDPVTLTFPEPLDHALLERQLRVTDAAGKTVAGTISIDAKETRWHFAPAKPWPGGAYQIIIETTLEDLAGNSIGKPFEVDVFDPIRREPRPETVRLQFVVKP